MTTTSGRPFTAEDILEAMAKAVEARGEDYKYIYPKVDTPDYWGEMKSVPSDSCLYVDPNDGTPSCIVGHAIHTLDPEAFQHLAEAERENPDTQVALRLIEEGFLPEGFWVEEAARIAQVAQTAQDSRLTWGEALQIARVELSLINSSAGG